MKESIRLVTLFLARKSGYEWLTKFQLDANFASDELSSLLNKATTKSWDEKENTSLYNKKISLTNENLSNILKEYYFIPMHRKQINHSYGFLIS